eukprot:snap_masked-scaffold_2-processed-gene-12.31-mRNA-1 protein AED:1.00 eAED:1.00 QI:0/0/0/0/1/1/2/0/177
MLKILYFKKKRFRILYLKKRDRVQGFYISRRRFRILRVGTGLKMQLRTLFSSAWLGVWVQLIFQTKFRVQEFHFGIGLKIFLLWDRVENVVENSVLFYMAGWWGSTYISIEQVQEFHISKEKVQGFIFSRKKGGGWVQGFILHKKGRGVCVQGFIFQRKKVQEFKFKFNDLYLRTTN